MSTTPNLALNEPAYNSPISVPGDPTWNVPLNYNSTILDQMFGNTTGVSVNTGSSPTYTLIAAPSATAAGSTSQAMRFNLTGLLAASQTVLLPQSVAGMWIISNNTTGSFTVTIGSNNGSNVAAGTTVAVPQSYSILVFSDGTNVKKADDGIISSGAVASFSGGSTGLTPSSATTGAVTLAGTLTVANGGTGAATLTANNVLLANGTGALQVVAPGTSGNILTSNGTTWTSAASGGLGNTSQAYTSVVGSRSLATSYTNSTSSPIHVIITASSSSAINFSLLASVNSGTAFTFAAAVANTFACGSFIVPPGQTYNVTASPSTGVTTPSWVELR